MHIPSGNRAPRKVPFESDSSLTGRERAQIITGADNIDIITGAGHGWTDDGGYAGEDTRESTQHARPRNYERERSSVAGIVKP